MVSARLEIDREDGILIDFNTGKFCLDPTAKQGFTIKDRSAQKNGTCWWYALMQLGTPHFINCSDLKSDQKELNKLLSARKEQHIKSQYRKGLSSCNKQRDSENELLKTLDKNGAITVAEAKEIKTNNSDKQKLIDEFVKDASETTLDVFCKNRNTKQRIKIAREVLENLGYDPDAERSKQMKNCYPNKEYADLSLEEKAVLFGQTIKNLFVSHPFYKKSSWDPSKGIDNLIDQIRKCGMLTCYGTNGLPYYNWKNNSDTFPEEKGIKTRHRLYHLEEKEYDTTKKGAHAINIVGAVKIKDKGYVIIHDPKQGSKKTDNNTAEFFLIPYDAFCSRLNNIYGVSYKTGQHSTTQTFGFYADRVKIQAVTEEYLEVIKGLSSVMPAPAKSMQV